MKCLHTCVMTKAQAGYYAGVPQLAYCAGTTVHTMVFVWKLWYMFFLW